MKQLSLVERGAAYVVVQAILIGLILFGPQGSSLLPQWSISVGPYLRLLGMAIGSLGLVLSIFAAFNLGKNLTPLPCPKDDAQLVRTGLYHFVRHPIYFGVLMVALGWLLIYPYALILVYVLALLIFFDFKTRREEVWLLERFPEYLDYQSSVKKLIPWVY